MYITVQSQKAIPLSHLKWGHIFFSNLLKGSMKLVGISKVSRCPSFLLKLIVVSTSGIQQALNFL